MSRKLFTGVVLSVALLGLTACAGDDAPDSAPSTSPIAGEESVQPEMPEPDTADIPDVVATVNDEDISGEQFIALYESQFQQMALQAQMSGQELDQDSLKEQALEGIINNRLLVQSALADGHEATDEDVNELLEEVASANGMESVDELIEAFAEQQVDEQQLRQDAHDQILITALVDELDIEQPSEEEIQEAYDAAVAQQEAMTEAGAEGEEAAELPDLEELRPQLEDQLIAEKENDVITSEIEKLRESATIDIHLS